MHPHAALYEVTYAGLVKCQEYDRKELEELEARQSICWTLSARQIRLEIKQRLFKRAVKISKAQLLLSALLAGSEADFVRVQVAMEQMHNEPR
jgi:hypothetical protein